MELRTKKEVLAAIKVAKEILISPRFGFTETWIKISKNEAKFLIRNLSDDTTPDDMEMGVDYFGYSNDQGKVLYLG